MDRQTVPSLVSNRRERRADTQTIYEAWAVANQPTGNALRCVAEQIQPN